MQPAMRRSSASTCASWRKTSSTASCHATSRSKTATRSSCRASIATASTSPARSRRRARTRCPKAPPSCRPSASRAALPKAPPRTGFRFSASLTESRRASMPNSKTSFSPGIPSTFGKGSSEMTEDQRLHLDAATQIKSPELKYSGLGVGSAPGESVESRYPITPPIDLAEPRHFFDYVRIVYKRRWLTGAVFVAVSISTAMYTYTRVPVYQATTRLLIDAQRQNYGFNEVTSESRVDYQTQYAILRSRSLIRKTMQNLGIWHEVLPGTSVSQPAPQPESMLSLSGAVHFVSGLFGSPAPKPTTLTPEARAVNESAAEARQIDGFLGGLAISPQAGSGIVDVTYTGS